MDLESWSRVGIRLRALETGLMGLAVDRGGWRKEAEGGGGNPVLGSVDVPGAPAAMNDGATPGGL